MARLAERDRHVLAVAERLFVEEGYHQVSLALVANRAGVATRTIYASFGEKRGLLEGILECRRKAAELALATLANQRHPLEKALRLLAAHAFQHELAPCLDLLRADLLAERRRPMPGWQNWAVEGAWRSQLELTLASNNAHFVDVFVACLMREHVVAPAWRACEPPRPVRSIDARARRVVAHFLKRICWAEPPQKA